MVAEDEFAEMLARARSCRARVDRLPDRTEIDSTIRGRVRSAADPPEPPPRHGPLITEIVELLEDPRLTSAQAVELERAFFRG